MDTLHKMISAASDAIDYLFNPVEEDKVLILTDTYSSLITEASKFAFGNNADFPGGGNNHSKVHRDFFFYNPTIKAFYSDGSEQIIIIKHWGFTATTDMMKMMPQDKMMN